VKRPLTGRGPAWNRKYVIHMRNRKFHNTPSWAFSPEVTSVTEVIVCECATGTFWRMDIASYEERSDPESLRMERTKKDHTFIWRESQNWQLTMCKIKYRNLYYMLFVISTGKKYGKMFNNVIY
jgi:hypothetical protein